jgi:hypothetical protein
MKVVNVPMWEGYSERWEKTALFCSKCGHQGLWVNSMGGAECLKCNTSFDIIAEAIRTGGPLARKTLEMLREEEGK